MRIALGATRVIIGPRGAVDTALVGRLLARHGSARLAVGIDAKQGHVAPRGTFDILDLTAVELARRVARQGVRTIIYNEVTRDGALTGPDIEGARQIAALGLDVIVSGGVGSLDDLRAMGDAGAHAVGLVRNGRVRPVGGTLAVAEGAKRAGLDRLICAAESGQEAALAGVEPVPVRHLVEAIEYLRGERDPPAVLASSGNGRGPPAPSPDLADVRGQERARRALELDGDLAEGHTSLAFVLQYHDWDWARADAAYRRAIDLNPGYVTARQWYADYLTGVGRLDEAFTEIERAFELDPLSPVVGTSYGDTLYYARRYEEAIARYRRVLELDAGYRWARFNIGRTLQEMGRHDEAIRTFEEAHRDAGMSLEVSPMLAYAWAAAGQRARTEAMMPGILEWWRAGHVSPYSVANIYVALGDHDQAITWLERALEDRDRMMVTLGIHPRLDPLRGDPRFASLLHRMNLPQIQPAP